MVSTYPSVRRRTRTTLYQYTTSSTNDMTNSTCADYYDDYQTGWIAISTSVEEVKKIQSKPDKFIPHSKRLNAKPIIKKENKQVDSLNRKFSKLGKCLYNYQ